jgi:hypothetical protein
MTYTIREVFPVQYIFVNHQRDFCKNRSRQIADEDDWMAMRCFVAKRPRKVASDGVGYLPSKFICPARDIGNLSITHSADISTSCSNAGPASVPCRRQRNHLPDTAKILVISTVFRGTRHCTALTGHNFNCDRSRCALRAADRRYRKQGLVVG